MGAPLPALELAMACLESICILPVLRLMLPAMVPHSCVCWAGGAGIVLGVATVSPMLHHVHVTEHSAETQPAYVAACCMQLLCCSLLPAAVWTACSSFNLPCRL